MIIVSHIYKRYKSGRGQVQALKDISFRTGEGKFLSIIGKSGSGKTTLLNCISGIERADSGEVICFGKRIYSLSPGELSNFLRSYTGFVFQRGNLFSYLNVYENIAFPLKLNNFCGYKIKDRVIELLEMVDLKDAANALPDELSGGEIQRIAVARAIAHRPKILFADEPTANLDSKTGMKLVELLYNLAKKEGTTVILATHDPDIINISDQILEIKDGIIIREVNS